MYFSTTCARCTASRNFQSPPLLAADRTSWRISYIWHDVRRILSAVHNERHLRSFHILLFVCPTHRAKNKQWKLRLFPALGALQYVAMNVLGSLPKKIRNPVYRADDTSKFKLTKSVIDYSKSCCRIRNYIFRPVDVESCYEDSSSNLQCPAVYIHVLSSPVQQTWYNAAEDYKVLPQPYWQIVR